ncbi:hypothetical protein BD310DRAFT_923817 [Dichomitus squalens]|uniref:Uncharacterized protein n=1 Tax=Dichomitus squalens TaxID=114155 RepID=A0A4Q9PZ25_9APHY|nr:hypothetical protein BD310DRAFT_923817 [Dichomitus squalens]
MNVLFVIRGSSSMKSAHIFRIRVSAAVVRFAAKCASNSSPEMKGDTASATPGAGAPYCPYRTCDVFVPSPDFTAHAFPSCGSSVVVSLSLNNPTSGCHSSAIAAAWIPVASCAQRSAVAESF